MRRKPATKRPVMPDPLFGNELLTRFINVVMRDGKKSVAEKVVYEALERVVAQTKSQAANKEGEDGEGSKGGKGGAKDKGGGIRTSNDLRSLALESFEKAL